MNHEKNDLIWEGTGCFSLTFFIQIMSDELSNIIVNEKNKHQAPVTHENLHLSKTKYNFKNLFYQGPAKEKTYCGVAFSLKKTT